MAWTDIRNDLGLFRCLLSLFLAIFTAAFISRFVSYSDQLDFRWYAITILLILVLAPAYFLGMRSTGVFRYARWATKTLLGYLYQTPSAYVELVLDSIKKTKRFDMLVVSAYTMFHSSAEKKIGDAILNLTEEQLSRVRIRALILDRSRDCCIERAEKFVKREGIEENIPDIDTYWERCKVAEVGLSAVINKAQPGSAIRLLNVVPVFRLYIFDEFAVVGIYDPDRSGHEQGMLRFPNGENHQILYNAFSEFFEREFQNANTRTA